MITLHLIDPAIPELQRGSNWQTHMLENWRNGYAQVWVDDVGEYVLLPVWTLRDAKISHWRKSYLITPYTPWKMIKRFCKKIWNAW